MVGGVTDANLGFGAGRLGATLGVTTSMPFLPDFAAAGVGIGAGAAAAFATGLVVFAGAGAGAFFGGAVGFFDLTGAAFATGFFAAGFALAFTGLRDVPVFLANSNRPQTSRL